ncbi:MAG: TIGR02452 family protein [Simkaniaceae bacterium]|nr:TIGR02452 family protein [Candidatus Sacchlamyda saccharinae]
MPAISPVKAKTNLIHQPSCMQQISSAALSTLKSPFTLTYYTFEWLLNTASYYLFGYGPYAKKATGLFYSGPELKGIWQQTESLIKAGSYEYSGEKVCLDKPGKTTRQSFWGFLTPPFITEKYKNALKKASQGHISLAYMDSFQTQFSVVNQDAVYAALDLKKAGYKVALLNPANAFTQGGGARWGAAAMEEDLCRRSALLPELDKQSYPLSGNTLLYTADVPFFRYGRDRHYAAMAKPETISVITSAAIDLNSNHGGGKWTKDAFEKETRLRAYAQLWKAAEEGNDAVVLTAFGCGAFRNDPEIVARIYRDLLAEKFHGVFKNVTFAVIDDHNTRKPHNPRGNYLPFREVFIQDKA